MLSLIPIILIELDQINVIVLGNLVKCSKTLPVKDEAYTNTNASKPASATNSVEVGLWIWLCIASALHWNIVVDDHGNRRDINTTGKNIGGDENLRSSLSEVLNDAVTF